MQHSTNYFNTLIEIADDCPSITGTIPPEKKGSKTIAQLQFELIKNNPYKYTSDDILFLIHAERNNLNKEDYDEKWLELFSKGQACLRTSPLTKRYGWGVHHNQEGKIALYSADSNDYHTFQNDSQITKVKAMRSKREKQNKM